MKILFVSSEAAPLAKVGGLGDVVGSLPGALQSLGHEVRILIPRYGSPEMQRFPWAPVIRGFSFPLPGYRAGSADLYRTESGRVTVYSLDAPLFSSPEIYGPNDLERFFFFSRAASAVLPSLDWRPEVLHCHDWLTALTVMWVKKSARPLPSVFTIHNLAYQGNFDESFLYTHDLKRDWEFFPPGAPRPPYSFLGQGILWADLVTTVSETYAREITTPEYGFGLDHLLRYRQDSLTGILNGLDYSEWDPLTDSFLAVNYDSSTLAKKVHNKYALQKLAGLPPGSEIPLIGLVQRLEEQKGMDIFGQAAETLLQETPAQFVILGRGRDDYENMVRQMASRFPGRVAAFIAFEEPLAHLIYGGCDMFLMPSRFEPCGLGQLIAMRYGSLPIVRHTGGLVDTVPPFTPDLRRGNGFVFHDYSPQALIGAVKQAAESFRRRSAWMEAAARVSRLDFSWQSSARQYSALYRRLLEYSGDSLP